MSSRPNNTSLIDRRFFIGGSDARIIIGDDETALVRLWREKRGEAEPEDLSGNLIVQLGTATEQLNRSWYERNTGRRIVDAQRRVKHGAIPWMAATLDGVVEGIGAVFESKFMLPWSFSEEATIPSRVAAIHGMAECLTCRWNVGDALTRITLVPGSVEVLRGRPELHDEVAGKVLRPDLAALLLPESDEGGLVVAHDDAGIGASDEEATIDSHTAHCHICLRKCRFLDVNDYK